MKIEYHVEDSGDCLENSKRLQKLEDAMKDFPCKFDPETDVRVCLNVFEEVKIIPVKDISMRRVKNIDSADVKFLSANSKSVLLKYKEHYYLVHYSAEKNE